MLGRGELHTGGGCPLVGVKDFSRGEGHTSVWGAPRMEERRGPGVTPQGFSWGREPCVGLRAGRLSAGIKAGRGGVPDSSHLRLS